MRLKNGTCIVAVGDTLDTDCPAPFKDVLQSILHLVEVQASNPSDNARFVEAYRWMTSLDQLKGRMTVGISCYEAALRMKESVLQRSDRE